MGTVLGGALQVGRTAQSDAHTWEGGAGGQEWSFSWKAVLVGGGRWLGRTSRWNMVGPEARGGKDPDSNLSVKKQALINTG